MALDTLTHAAELDSAASDFATFGPVHVDVIDPFRSLRFWRDAMGMEVTSRTRSADTLGTAGRDLVALHPGAKMNVQPGYSGLYHFAIYLPNLTEYARAAGPVFSAGFPNPPTDHLEALGLIIEDPDGICVELALETRGRVRSTGVGPDGLPVGIDVNGMREPVDLSWLLRLIPDGQVDGLLPPGTFVGHIHLSVRDLDEALAFYRDTIGFTPQRYSARLGFADMSLGGAIRHRLALNTWQGKGASRAPDGTAGMRYFTLGLASTEELSAIVVRVEEAHHPVERHLGEVYLLDPSGNRLALTAVAS